VITLDAFRLLGLVALGTVLVLVLVAVGLALWGLVLAILSGAGEPHPEELPEESASATPARSDRGHRA
jgi:hypothetical protein